jgi:hypothetical protein
MTTMATSCLNGEGQPKASYPSEHAARAALKRSPRWRLRAEWPAAYLCRACHRWNLGHPRVEQ